jgi:rhodanese-related sulfurtransferase
VADPGREIEAKIRLARIGFDNVRGAILDVERELDAHPELATTASRLTASDLAGWLGDAPSLQLVDVRNPGELQEGAIPGAVNIPLPTLLERADTLDPAAPTVVYCASGVRSSIAASLLRTKGFAVVADVLGGYAAWASAGTPA